MLIPTFKFNKLTRTDLLQFDGVNFVNVPVYAVGKNVMWGPEGVGYNSLIVGSVTKNIPLVNHKHTTNDILGLQKLINDLGVNSGTSIDLSNYLLTSTFIDHLNNINSAKHVTQAHLDKLNSLNNYWQLDEQGNLYTTYNTYSTQGLSAFGLGSNGGGGGGDGGGVDMLDDWVNYTEVKADYYVPASLLVPFRNDTLSRLTSLESGGGNGGGTEYILPTASATTLGGVKVGNGLTISSGVLSVIGGGGGDGSVTSVGLSVPTGLSVTGSPITSSGTLAISFASGYSIPTTAKQTNWDSAYTHSQATSNPHGVTKAQVGLGNVLNVASYSKTESDALLALNLNKSVFNDLFEKVEVSAGVYAIKAKYDFYSIGGVSAYGLDSGGSGGSTEYILPTATSTTLGGIKVGDGLTISSGVLSVIGGGGGDVEISITGSGNAITGVSKSGNTLTFAKSSTFALSTHNHTIAQVTDLQSALNAKQNTLIAGANITISGNTISSSGGISSVAWGDITGKPTTFAPSAHTHDATHLTSGIVPVARLGSNTATSALYLRGDNQWVTPPNTNTTYTAGNGIGLSTTTFSVAGGNGLVQETSGLALGTPSTITNSTTNSVGASSHTHALTVTKADVGLGNADNTSDANKPISTATQNALNLKAPLASPTFTGIVTAPTFSGALDGNASTATTATKLGTATVGSTQLPFYLNAGTATAITQANLRIGLFGATAIGSATQPVYIAANGVPTASTSFGGVTGIGTASPLMDGAVAVGTSTLAARQDHRHPVDTSRAAVGQTMYIGTTAVAINRASATLNLTGIGSLAMGGALSGATTISASSTITATGNILSSANIIANTGITIAQTASTGVGLSLYGNADTDTSTNPIYGLMFATTASKGTHGAVTGTHATYFTMHNTTGRGWIFTTDPVGTTGNVASISNAGVFTSSQSISTVSVTTPKVIFASAGWSMEQSSEGVLELKYNGVIKQKFLNDGSIAATGELTAYVAGASGYSEFLPLSGGTLTGNLNIGTGVIIGTAAIPLSVRGNAFKYNNSDVLYKGNIGTASLPSIGLSDGWTIEIQTTPSALLIKKNGVIKGTFNA